MDSARTKINLPVPKPKAISIHKLADELSHVGEYFQPSTEVYRAEDADKYIAYLESVILRLKKNDYPKLCLLNKRRATRKAICVRCQRNCPFAGKRRSYKKKS